MKPSKHTPTVQAKLRNRDTTIRDGVGPRKVDVDRLAENLKRARLAGNGPLLKSPPVVREAPVDPVTTITTVPASVPAARRRVESVARVHAKPCCAPAQNGPFEVLDTPPPADKHRCHDKYRDLEHQLVALPVGKYLIWPDPPKGRTTAQGVVFRIGERHGFRFSTYMSKGSMVVNKRGLR